MSQTAKNPEIEPAPLHLHCADAPEQQFTPEEEMERAKVVMQSAPRMPAVGFFGSRYGEKWHVDMVALPHNAVRRQLYDAFTIANALGKLNLDVAAADLDRVYAWLGTLDYFISATLAAEDKFLYPIIDANIRKAKTADGNPAYLPEFLSIHGRRSAKAQIRELLTNARKTRDVATGETSAKINALRYALDQFGANVLDYYAAMEKFVPKLLKKSLRNGQKEKDKLERKLFDYLLSESHGTVLAVMLMQCIESRTKRADFIVRNIKKEKDRQIFRAHVKTVEETHMRLASYFDAAASKYERRFNVNTFLEHYDTNTDAQQTLEMLGDIDLNDEEDSAAAAPAAITDGASTQLPEENRSQATPAVGLDDDVIEVLTDV